MDPTEIIKAAPEIAKGLTAIGAAIPFTAIVKKMLGLAADEVAEMLRDRVRLYRYGNQMRCIEKAEKMAKDAGFTPKAVPPKILFPLLEGASFEDDEGLHDMWATLLASAASDRGQSVRPGFIAILREMAPDEAYMLQLISALPGKFGMAYEAAGFVVNGRGRKVFVRALENADPALLESEMERIQVEYRREFSSVVGEGELEDQLRYEACRQMLEVAGLIELSNNRYRPQYVLTSVGEMFLDVCTPPKPKP
jgi:hypothetical protein